MNDNLAVEASGLAKSYRDVPVLDGVDLEIPRGSVFALLGPNGAGKTTTVRILATLTEADAGQARVHGGAGRARGGQRAAQPRLHRAGRRGRGRHRVPAARLGG